MNRWSDREMDQDKDLTREQMDPAKRADQNQGAPSLDSEELPLHAAEVLADSLGDVEAQLGQLLDELRGLQVERHVTKIADAGTTQRSQIQWDSSLESFVLKATVIRRMLSQFRGSDLSTRRYLRHQLDEEFENLKSAYGSLSEQFTMN